MANEYHSALKNPHEKDNTRSTLDPIADWLWICHAGAGCRPRWF